MEKAQGREQWDGVVGGSNLCHTLLRKKLCGGHALGDFTWYHGGICEQINVSTFGDNVSTFCGAAKSHARESRTRGDAETHGPPITTKVSQRFPAEDTSAAVHYIKRSSQD